MFKHKATIAVLIFAGALAIGDAGCNRVRNENAKDNAPGYHDGMSNQTGDQNAAIPAGLPPAPQASEGTKSLNASSTQPAK